MLNNLNNKRLAKNTITLYIRTGIVTLVSLYMARVLLDALGQENYGIYNVVASIVVTFSFFNSTLQSAFQRFLTFSLGKKDELQFSKIYTMSILILAVLVLLVIILSESFGVWFLNSKLNIPADRMYYAQGAFHFTILTFCIGVMKIPFESVVIAHEKMAFFAYVSLLEQGLRLLMVYLLYRSPIDELVFYAGLVSCVSLLTFIVYVVYCRSQFCYCKVVRQWDGPLFKQLLSFSGWTLVGSTSSLGAQQLFVFLLNIFYGVIANAAMGIATNVVAAVNSFFAGFQTSFRPQIIKSYANHEYDYLKKMISSTSKISFILMFIPAVLLIINTPFILAIWLKNVPEYTVAFCRLFLICAIIDATTGPYNIAIIASGKIKYYELCISVVFFLDILGVLALFKLNVGAEYILYSRIATRGVLNMFIGLYFLNRQFNFDVKGYLKNVIFPIILFLTLSSPLLLLIVRCFSGWTLMMYSFLYVMIVCVVLSFFIVLNKKERSLLFDLVRNKLSIKNNN